MAMVDIKIIKQQCSGRWHSILSNLGIPESYLTGKHGPCIICGGVDRWRWDNKDGTGSWFCSQCNPHAGDGIKLVQRFIGCSLAEALEKIQSIVGGCEVQTQKEKPKYDIKKMLNTLWNKSNVLTGSDPVSVYLHRRGLVLQPDNVRYCSECYHKELDKKIPAMIARIQNKEGKPISLHRIYLQEDAMPKKKLMPVEVSGCVVRLFQPKNNTVIVCEGIETGIACKQIFDEGVYACISSAILESFEPPEGIRKVIICADNDASFAGQKAAYNLANRLYNKDLLVEVQMPDKKGVDFNDVLKNS